MPMIKRRTALAAGGVSLAACAVVAASIAFDPPYELTPAPLADTAACRKMARSYPDQLSGLEREDTDAPGAAAWGDGAVIARCGFPLQLPSEEACAEIDEVDWLWRTRQDREGMKTLIVYGREPALQVQIDPERAAPDEVMVDLTRIVKHLPRERRCISVSDTLS
ncbi:DUF3515 family protein [Streptomyces sp. NPDC002851]